MEIYNLVRTIARANFPFDIYTRSVMSTHSLFCAARYYLGWFCGVGVYKDLSLFFISMSYCCTKSSLKRKKVEFLYMPRSRRIIDSLRFLAISRKNIHNLLEYINILSFCFIFSILSLFFWYTFFICQLLYESWDVLRFTYILYLCNFVTRRCGSSTYTYLIYITLENSPIYMQIFITIYNIHI